MGHKKSANFILIGTSIFILLLSLCVMIRPVGLLVNSGISYYGNYLNTLLPYTLAFVINSYLFWRASLAINNSSKIDVYFKLVLKIVAILMIGILLTPYNAYHLTELNLVHRGIGTLIFSSQIIMAAVIILFAYRDWLMFVFLVASLFSGYAAIVYMLQPTGYMIEAQIVFQASIWIIFVRYLNYADSRLSGKVYNKVGGN